MQELRRCLSIARYAARESREAKHALVGALMIGIIRNALNLLNVDIFFQLIAIGVIIVLAVEAAVMRGTLEERFRLLQSLGLK